MLLTKILTPELYRHRFLNLRRIIFHGKYIAENGSDKDSLILTPPHRGDSVDIENFFFPNF